MFRGRVGAGDLRAFGYITSVDGHAWLRDLSVLTGLHVGDDVVELVYSIVYRLVYLLASWSRAIATTMAMTIRWGVKMLGIDIIADRT